MNIIYLIFFNFSLMCTFMQELSRKKELLNRFGFISPQILNGYDYLWILNTSCNYCSIKISCKTLSLYYYHSVVFSSLTYPILQDATFKNYSLCPDVFYSRTDKHGFYFVHYYHYYYTKFQDKFNFSYSVSNLTEVKHQTSERITEICDISFNQTENFIFDSNNFNNNCPHWTHDCIFCSRFMHASVTVDSCIYVHGGLSATNIHNRVFIRYINGKWSRVPVKSEIEPPCLFAHSIDYNILKNELTLFGGLECGSDSKKYISDIIWVFDLSSYIWTRLKESNSKPAFGHSIHVYENVMYSFFGLTNFSSTEKPMLSIIQKFNFSAGKWTEPIFTRLVNNFDGLIYHSTSRNGSIIWVYGGLTMTDFSSISVSNALYALNLHTNECYAVCTIVLEVNTWNAIHKDLTHNICISGVQWNTTVKTKTSWLYGEVVKVIDSAGPHLYLHSMAFVNDILFVVGGKIVTEDPNNRTLTKISPIIYQFDVLKSRWNKDNRLFINVGGQLSLKNTSTILIVGGKISAYRIALISLNFEQSNFNIYKSQSLTTSKNAGQVSSGNCHHFQCESCVESECVWCALSKTCISRFQLAILFIVGECNGPILYRNQCPVKCEDLSNSGCRNCTKLQFCGWCEFKDVLSGVGRCIEGTVYGPNINSNKSKSQEFRHYSPTRTNWSFLPSHCSTCNCNGHASCLSQTGNYQRDSQNSLTLKCSKCLHNASGDHCQKCKQGFQGSAINGQKCSPCKCLINKSARYCNPDGDCSEYCIEKGRIGKYCNECDVHNNFTKFHGMCVIKSKINFKYVLNETDNFNTYTSRVRFLLTDLIPNVDLGFRVRCINSYGTKIKVELFNASGNREILLSETNCTFLENTFPKSLFEGKVFYQLLFTISGFNVLTLDKFHIELIFTQKVYTNLPYIFISIFACIFTALLLFYTIYKMHQHMRLRNRNYHPFLILERPYVKIILKTKSDLEANDNDLEVSNLIDSDNHDGYPQSKFSHQCPLVCIEPYLFKDGRFSNHTNESKTNSTTAVVTFLFQSPKCTLSSMTSNSQDSLSKHLSRILIGSTVIKLSEKERKLLLDLPTKSSSGNNLMVERDFDTSISPSAADELMITEV